MRTTLLSFLLFTLPIIAFSQNLTLSWHDGVVPNGSILDVSGRIDTVIVAEVLVHNEGLSTIEVKVRKENIHLVPGAMDTYCFASQCYGSEVPVSVHSVHIDPGMYDSTFYGDYYPLGNEGTSIFRYTFFNVADTTDTVSVTIRYSGTLNVPVIDKPAPGVSNAYPNPASDRVSFDYFPVNSEGTRLMVIRDMAGRLVRESIIPSDGGTLEIDLSDIENGIYFYSLIQGNKLVLTRKLVVKK